MKKPILFFAALGVTLTSQAQINFTEVTGTPFTNVNHASLAFADIDGDGDEDVLITGEDGTGAPNSTLYTNDGTGTFSVVSGTSFVAVKRGSIAFTDVNGDGHQDVLITGEDATSGGVTKLYTNSGTGTFTEVAGTPFVGVKNSSVAFADVNGNGFQDLLISGESTTAVTKLYTNNGSGVFTEVMNTSLTQLKNSGVAFADVDGDGDQDLFMNGNDATNAQKAELYINNGSGNFVVVAGAPFHAHSGSEVTFMDYDGDGDQDLLLGGANYDGTKKYSNDGSGGFTSLMSSSPFAWQVATAVADVDGDGDLDVWVGGKNEFDEENSRLGINDNAGAFTYNYSIVDVFEASGAFSDIDSDGDPDLLVAGGGYNTGRTVKLYRNETPQLENVCAGADTINNLFGGTLNTPVVSSLYNNTVYSSAANDPTTGFSCFEENGAPSLDNTIWYTFTGDGNAYRIRTVQCNATNYIDNGDTQIAIYEGTSCNNLTPVACNEDEDYAAGLWNVNLILETTAGTEYRMLIDGHDGVNGEFCLEVTRIGVTGIEDGTVVNNIALYPNPTTDNINWDYVGAQHAQVYDFTGRVVFTEATPKGTLNISELPAGIYTLILQTEKGTYSSKVVKQ